MKYLRVAVTKLVSTDVFVFVSDDFDANVLYQENYQEKISEVLDKQTEHSESIDEDWEFEPNSLEVQAVTLVSEKQCNSFGGTKL